MKRKGLVKEHRKVRFSNDIHSFQSISTSADLTRHSRQLLADAYLETGIGDTHDFDSELLLPDTGLPISQHQHAFDEDIDSDSDDDTNESVDKRTEEIIYRCVFLVLLLSTLTEILQA
jgi:hypothetical protein